MPGALSETARAAVRQARAEGRPLFEHESYALLEGLGVAVPAWLFQGRDEDPAELALDSLPGDRVVVKLVARGLLHKSRVGGVVTVAKQPEAVARAIEQIAATSGLGDEVAGYLLCEHVEHDVAGGGELLLGVRWDREMGALVVLGPGGLDAELEAERREGEGATACLAPGLGSSRSWLRRPYFAARLGGGREEDARRAEALQKVVDRALQWAEASVPGEVEELEINPLVWARGRWVALDAVARAATGSGAPARRPPLEGLDALLEPRSIAVAGVSARGLNPGRRILRRVRAAGYAGRLVVIKADCASLDGAPCVPDLGALEHPVDLLVLSLPATSAVTLLEEAVVRGAARSVVLVAGGFEEHEGGALGVRVRDVLAEARRSDRPSPVVNGGNCLGIWSRPGRLDTLFLPEATLPVARGEGAPVAFLSQSGAFAVARTSRLAGSGPRYLISVGNQIDLTLGDYLAHLERDPAVAVFACYVEGFRDLDGRRFLEAAARIRSSGRAVVLYRAGRSRSGAAAAATHTAAIAGSYRVTRELAAAAGVLVADTLDELDDLVHLLVALDRRRVVGRGLAAVSNAGFECVVTADAAARAGLDLATLAGSTHAALGALLRERGLEHLVGSRNPLDATPMLDDEGFVAAARCLLDDPAVDLGVVGCVPFSGALYGSAEGPGENGGSVRLVHSLARLFAETAKPWVLVVDAGARFDPLAAALVAAGLPVFRSADRAVRMLARVALWQLGSLSS